MANLSRKHFIERGSAGAVAACALTTLPAFALNQRTASAAPSGAAATHQGPLLAHVRNVATGEIAVLVGTREVVIYDREVARRLLGAAR